MTEAVLATLDVPATITRITVLIRPGALILSVAEVIIIPPTPIVITVPAAACLPIHLETAVLAEVVPVAVSEVAALVAVASAVVIPVAASVVVTSEVAEDKQTF